MKRVKAKSSKYINDHQLTPTRFEWQRGYGVFSYRQRDVDTIYKYVQNQEVHHKTQSFKEEYINFLKEFQVDYNKANVFEELE